MTGIITCHRGMEDMAALEVKELLSTDAETGQGYVRFPATLDEVKTLALVSQSALGCYLALGTYASLDALKDGIPDLTEQLGGKRFMVTAECLSAHPEETRADVGAAIIASHDVSVDLTAPERVVHVLEADSWLLLLDVAGWDLGKRSYRIFLANRAIKASLAYSLIRLSGYHAGETLLDPFCRDGTIPIEAALWTLGRSPRWDEREKLLMPPPGRDEPESERLPILAFDSLFRHVDAARKNAKIATVNKAIGFSRMEVSWLDTKFEEGEVDRIVCRMADPGKHTDAKKIERLQTEFFHQAAFILSKNGNITMLTHHPELVVPLAETHGFSAQRRTVWQGQESLEALVFRR